MARINVDDGELRGIKRALAEWAPPGKELPRMFPLLAIDPGKRSMGWAYVDTEAHLHSGQGPPDEVVSRLDVVMEMCGPPLLYVFEGPYTVTAASLAEKRGGGVKAIQALARSTGYVHGGLRRHLRRSVGWEPAPSTWRAILGLNRRRDELVTAREATLAAVLMWVRATTKRPLLTDNGADREDEAMAIAIAYAGLSMLSTVFREMRPPPARSATRVHPARKTRRAAPLELPGVE